MDESNRIVVDPDAVYCLTMKGSCHYLYTQIILQKTVELPASGRSSKRKIQKLTAVRKHNTGRLIMFSVITNIYNKKTKGPTLMEFFTATFSVFLSNCINCCKLQQHIKIYCCNVQQFMQFDMHSVPVRIWKCLMLVPHIFVVFQM
jgi:hypothetical protein